MTIKKLQKLHKKNTNKNFSARPINTTKKNIHHKRMNIQHEKKM